MANLAAHVETSLPESRVRAASTGQSVELFLLAICLPAAVAFADQLVLRRLLNSGGDAAIIFFTYALFVIQIGLVSTLVGLRLRSGLVKWVIFLWMIVLVDLQVFTITALDADWTSSVRCLAFAFMSGQVGLLTVWGLLSTFFWALRLPIAALGLALVISFASAFGGGSDLWFAILCWQSLGTAVLCSLMWACGFRIRHAAGRAGGRRMQFSVRHLFAWTTTVACVVGVARLIDVTSFLFLGRDSLLPCVGLGGCFAIISIVAVWGALGAESFLIRLLGLALSTPLIALAVGAVGLAGLPQWVFGQLFLGRVYDPYLWLSWTCLATFFLASLLIVFRASGYRLLRQVSN